MSRCCEDCGCLTDSAGTCSNCHEELWIETYQGEFIESSSDEWNRKVEEQKKAKVCKQSRP